MLFGQGSCLLRNGRSQVPSVHFLLAVDRFQILVALFQAGSTGLIAVDTASRADEALERARSHLAALGAEATLVPGDTEEDDGGSYRWHQHIRPIASRPLPLQDAGAAASVTLFDVNSNLPGPTIVVEVLECHSHDLRWQSLWQFSTMLCVKAKSMFC